MRLSCRLLCAALGLAFLVTACGEPADHDDEEQPPEGIGRIQSALSSINCGESTATGYTSGKAFTITVVTVDGKKVEKASANAYYVMAQKAAAAGVNIAVVSGFRTMAEQQYLYNCYVKCSCNNCNLAAKPGYSNHQSGHALDLNTSAPGVLSWLNGHAATYGWKRTVPSESWHWEWWGGGPGGGPCGKPTHPQLSIDVGMETLSGQGRDFCQLGKSKDIFDWWEGQETVANVDVKNSGDGIAKHVRIGLWVEQPYLRALKWNIYSNFGGGGFKINDTDGLQKIPHDNPGGSFSLELGSVSPNETKRITLRVRADKFSLGLVDHPDVRAWVAHIDDHYEKTSFDDKPTNKDGLQKQNGGDLRAYAQTDVLAKERCDSADNDCDGKVDEDGVCASPPPPAPPAADSGVPPAAPDAGVPLPEPDVEPQLTAPPENPTDAPPEGAQSPRPVEGCALAPDAAAWPLGCVPLAALALLACIRRRRR